MSVYPVSTGAVTELDTLVAGTDWTANRDPDGGGTNRTSQVDIEIELQDFNEVHITITYPTTGWQSVRHECTSGADHQGHGPG